MFRRSHSLLNSDVHVRHSRRTGVVAESLPGREHCNSALAALSSGRLTLIGIEVDAGLVFSSAVFVSSSVPAGTPTNQWFAFFDPSRNLFAITGDDTTAAWPANTEKELAFGGAPLVVPRSGLWYLGIVVVATTVPNLIGYTAATTAVGLAPILGGSGNTGLTNPASCPAQPTLAATGFMPLAFLK